MKFSSLKIITIFSLLFFLLNSSPVIAIHIPGGTHTCIFPYELDTAIGCISTRPGDFVTRIVSIAVGVAGGIAFLILVYGGFKIVSSRGDPDALEAGRNVITSAIAGLLFILFSVMILRIAGIDILGLPLLTK